MASGQVWKIRGYQSTNLVFESSVPFGHLSEKGVQELLKRLASRHLTCDETVTASLNKPYRSGLLDVVQNRGGVFGYSTVDGLIFYTAMVGERENA